MRSASLPAAIWQQCRASSRRLLAHLLPRACLLCGQDSGSAALCPHCHHSLPGRWRVRCRQCALPLAPGQQPPAAAPAAGPDGPDSARPVTALAGQAAPAGPAAGSSQLCPACARRPAAALSRVIALADYAPPLDQAIAALKFGQALALARPFGELLAARLQDESEPVLPALDAIVPIPLSGPRLAERGFNQSLQIARALRQALPRAAPPLANSWLQRLRHSPPQSSLPASERRRNLAGAFVAAPAAAGMRIALVDDVMTTGSTLHEAAHTLKAAGAATVMALVIARTPSPHRH